jgi:succinylglutamate desuccinylase
MKKQPKILFIISTHGDEKIGLEVIKKLLKKGLGSQFDFITANPFALASGTRYIEKDLNRSYPGNSTSNTLEEALADHNLSIAQRYEFVIDLHEAQCGTDNFIIIPRDKMPNDFSLNLIDLETVLLWPDPRGPLGETLKNTVELEFGMQGKNREDIICIAARVCETFLARLADGNYNREKKQNIYDVYGKITLEELPHYKNYNLTDFKRIAIGQEEFYPLLVGQYLESGIICYKMRKNSLS